jgi:hypothetical protein
MKEGSVVLFHKLLTSSFKVIFFLTSRCGPPQKTKSPERLSSMPHKETKLKLFSGKIHACFARNFGQMNETQEFSVETRTLTNPPYYTLELESLMPEPHSKIIL